MRFAIFGIFITVFAAVQAAAHVYLWRRLVRDTGLTGRTRKLATVAIVFLALLAPFVVALSRQVPRDVIWPLPVTGWLWLGTLFYLVLLVVMTDLVGWVGRRARRGPPQAAASDDDAMDRRHFLSRAVAGGSIIGASSLGGFGVSSALGDFYQPEVEVRLPRLPPQLDGYRIALLSDIHIGPTLDARFLGYVVETCNAARPDLIVITGDLVDARVAHIGRDVAELRHLRARDGVFFTTGNHEFYSGAADWVRFLPGLGVRVLANERVSVGDRDKRGASFDLAGIHDRNGGRYGDAWRPDLARALAGRDPERELVLLAHQPKQIDMSLGAGVGLQLSGHTHGGQMWPFGELTKLAQPYLAGHHTETDGTQIYVTNGTGFWGPPMRVLAPPEITTLVLVSA